MKTVAVLCVIPVLINGCGGGGDDSPAFTTDFTVTSTSFANGAAIPLKHAETYVGGSNVSPQLSLTNIPSTATNVSIIMDDETLPCGTGTSACVHWNVLNLPASKTSIAENETLPSANVLSDYSGPFPPPYNPHTYKITVYTTSAAVPSPTLTQLTHADFEANYGSLIIKKYTYTGTYTYKP